MQVKVPRIQFPDPTGFGQPGRVGNMLFYPPGGAKVAGRLAQELRHWTYGAPLAKGQLRAGDIVVRLQATWAADAVFYDTLTGNPTLRDRFQDGDGMAPRWSCCRAVPSRWAALQAIAPASKTSSRSVQS